MSEPVVFSDTFFAMGTRCDVVLPGVEQTFGEQIFQLVRNEVRHLEHRLSRFIPDSPIAGLNRAKRDQWLPVDEELWDILTICYDFYQMSNGAFDITAAPVISLWKKAEPPSEKEIGEALKISGFDKVEFDFENRCIRFLAKGVEFDLGAVGKGIALDTLKPVLQKQGVTSGIISFGESSILALGNHPNGEPWPLGIRNQVRADEFVHVFSASDETVTTSGTILTNDEGELVSRHHIISPATGLPVGANGSISVKSESATMGEFISTAWLILPENDKIILSEKLKNIEILEVTYLEDNDVKTRLSILND